MTVQRKYKTHNVVVFFYSLSKQKIQSTNEKGSCMAWVGLDSFMNNSDWLGSQWTTNSSCTILQYHYLLYYMERQLIWSHWEIILKKPSIAQSISSTLHPFIHPYSHHKVLPMCFLSWDDQPGCPFLPIQTQWLTQGPQNHPASCLCDWRCDLGHWNWVM